MLVWFVAIATMGIWGIVQHPSVFAALNPVYGLSYLFSHGATGFWVLGAVFLCVTGAEALYADMGHFGRGPIKLALVRDRLSKPDLNYAGPKRRLVLEGAPTDGNIFFRLCPAFLLIPLVVLATVATIIASQSIITGAFSMTRQAIQLGWLPRLRIKQTSSEGYGQIYVGVVNWLLMIVTVGLTIGFRKSDNLASAYGIAVSLTMLMTSALLFIAMREIWGWSVLAAGTVAGFFLIVDSAFFLANLTKIGEGGYVPVNPGCLRLQRDVDLASRSGGRLGADARSADPGSGIHGQDMRKRTCAGSRHGGVHDPDRAGYAAFTDLGEIGKEEGAIDDEKEACDGASSQHAPAPDSRALQ